MGMLTDKVFFQFGQNNINFTQNSGPSNAPLSILDAVGENTILMINFTLGRINSLVLPAIQLIVLLHNLHLMPYLSTKHQYFWYFWQ
jgi:hypothetical protein